MLECVCVKAVEIIAFYLLFVETLKRRRICHMNMFLGISLPTRGGLKINLLREDSVLEIESIGT